MCYTLIITPYLKCLKRAMLFTFTTNTFTVFLLHITEVYLITGCKNNTTHFLKKALEAFKIIASLNLIRQQKNV
jgi:hypothetical protein